MPDIFVAKEHAPNKEETAAPQPTTTPAPVVSDFIPVPKTTQQKHPHLFSSYCENPDAISFQNQEPNEKILLFLRKHFITNLPWISMTIFLLFVPAILQFIFTATKVSFPIPPRFDFFIVSLYYLFVFTYALVSFFTWFFNISLITEERVIDISFSELVYKNVSATKLDLVQDASYVQIGVIRSLFDYGDLLIQTAGTLDNFDLLGIPHPEKAIQIVENLIGKERNGI